MLRAEILTDMGQYEVKLEGITDPVEGWKVVGDTIASGMFFLGENELLHIGKDAQIKHVRVFDDEKIAPPVAAPQPGQNSMPDQEIVNWVTEFLGQRVAVRILLVHNRKGSRTIALPVAINDKPPGQQLKPETQGGLLLTWAKEQGGFWYGLEIDTLAPEADLGDLEAYKEYAQDYIEETRKRPAPTGKNARAWDGWGASDKP